MTRLKTLLTATLLILNSQAMADPLNKMTLSCAVNYCVYDGDNHILGIFQQEGIVNRKIGNKLYFAGYTAAGFTVDLELFYLSTNCTGQPHIASGYIDKDGATPVPNGPPGFAEWDGAAFWGPVDATQVVAPQSFTCAGAICNDNPPNVCLPYRATLGPYYPAFAPAAKIETPTITRTAGCVAAQSCVVVK